MFEGRAGPAQPVVAEWQAAGAAAGVYVFRLVGAHVQASRIVTLLPR